MYIFACAHHICTYLGAFGASRHSGGGLWYSLIKVGGVLIRKEVITKSIQFCGGGEGEGLDCWCQACVHDDYAHLGMWSDW